MRKEKALIGLLQDLVKLVSDEAERNTEFAVRLDALLVPIPSGKTAKRPRVTAPKQNLPDIHAEFNSRGESEFHHWLREQPIAILRALIRQHDLDTARRTAKWKEADKLSAFITDQIRARLDRGSGFLSSGDRESSS